MATNYTRKDATASAPTHAEQMVTKLQAEILAGAGGVASTSVDGTSVSINRAQLLDELKYWQKQVGREKGTRPIMASAKLG
tara:strand:+ start:213 stop:455 length:243 start_codon:yes stop_codon:yes gene_type:complete